MWIDEAMQAYETYETAKQQLHEQQAAVTRTHTIMRLEQVLGWTIEGLDVSQPIDPTAHEIGIGKINGFVVMARISRDEHGGENLWLGLDIPDFKRKSFTLHSKEFAIRKIGEWLTEQKEATDGVSARPAF